MHLNYQGRDRGRPRTFKHDGAANALMLTWGGLAGMHGLGPETWQTSTVPLYLNEIHQSYAS